MTEELLFKQMDFIRKRTIFALDATNEQLADEMPQGFRNTIRWNFGHIFLTQDTLMSSFIGEEPHVPDDYYALFERDTSPLNWNVQPPSLGVLREQLINQSERIRMNYSRRLEENIVRPFQIGDYQLITLGEILAFANWHEGLHQGAINSIKRAAGIEELWKL
ncbi:DinB family protein [Sutcliffiella halmapala]|uniref:DinB family protein n=1 Tax=Sutcliffiella halmapala TaxID=79882 RepID=UPI000994EF47|nr:DinB family protein [Sutcliffiella halmapala]